jgi:hypothetical protein
LNVESHSEKQILLMSTIKIKKLIAI